MVEVSPTASVRAMVLITILNRCHRFRRFVYQQAHFSADKKSIEVAVRPRKGSAAICSRCHLPAPGYDQLGERCFEFIPLWGFLVFLVHTAKATAGGQQLRSEPYSSRAPPSSRYSS